MMIADKIINIIPAIVKIFLFLDKNINIIIAKIAFKNAILSPLSRTPNKIIIGKDNKK